MAGFFRELGKEFRVIKEVTPSGDKVSRSPLWPSVRLEKIKEAGYRCQCCGKEAKYLGRWTLQVHHIIPFHIDPSKELDKSNLVVLCGHPSCHLDKGHLRNFKSFNPNVIEDCKIWNQKYSTKPF